MHCTAGSAGFRRDAWALNPAGNAGEAGAMSEASTDSTPHVPLVHGPQRGAGIASDASSEAQSDALSTLPPELRERCRLPHARACASPDPGARGSTHVLYWVHHALRVDENPALEVASSFAAERALPLLVCATVSTAHRPLTDRHVGFFLEGLREFAIDLAERGVECVLSAELRESAVDVVARLADGAAVIVTDDFPAVPFPALLDGLRQRVRCPLVAVDGACLVPMNATTHAYDRAFAFRDATARNRTQRFSRPWTGSPWPALPRAAIDHAFPRTDWAALDVAETVASLEIDHAVGPVADTPGGSRAAEARWAAFRDTRLDGYARDRNDAVLPATSRMSAYLHFGMISAMRIAREAAAHGGEGAAKFLDELLVWREFAYHWCRHTPNQASMAALPSWARATLDAHRSDPRDVVPRERLSRGSTGVRLWDLAQRSLVVHGELHNNLRMTWGKAIPQWTATPEDALDTLVELNDRFALDGGDPSSYAGLLWCLGLFDRPFAPECAVLGRVRPRPIDMHADRLDVDAYERVVARPAHGSARRSTVPLRVAVIGAGIAGTACARTLADHGVTVTILEKSRGPGGRISTRRGDAGAFDHGAQYFSVRDARFGDRVRDWVEQGVVARWDGRFAEVDADGVRPLDAPPRFVGVPGMGALCGHLASGVAIETSTRVQDLLCTDHGWMATTPCADGSLRALGPFDVVLSTAPAPQSSEMLAVAAPALAAIARAADMRTMWSLMLSSTSPIALSFDHARVLDDGCPLAWISRISSKPGRVQDGRDRWVLLARDAWSVAHLEDSADSVAAELAAAFSALCARLSVALPALDHLSAHRWRHALPARADGGSSAFDAERGIGIAGDWMRGPRVEDAYLSGVSLAGRVLGASSRVSGSALRGQ